MSTLPLCIAQKYICTSDKALSSCENYYNYTNVTFPYFNDISLLAMHICIYNYTPMEK